MYRFIKRDKTKEESVESENVQPIGIKILMYDDEKYPKINELTAIFVSEYVDASSKARYFYLSKGQRKQRISYLACH